MAKVLENYKKTNFSSKSQPGACLAVCLIFWPISAWRAYKLRAYKKNVYSRCSLIIDSLRPNLKYFTLNPHHKTPAKIGVRALDLSSVDELDCA